MKTPPLIHNYDKQNSLFDILSSVLNPRNHVEYKPKYGTYIKSWVQTSRTYTINFNTGRGFMSFMTDDKSKLKHALKLNDEQDAMEARLYCEENMEVAR